MLPRIYKIQNIPTDANAIKKSQQNLKFNKNAYSDATLSISFPKFIFQIFLIFIIIFWTFITSLVIAQY
jgi:hypothetical protein